MTSEMLHERYGQDLALNLKEMVGYYSSIAEVCRKVGINRQQFNKYLGGSSFPSRSNLRRISDFFGVEENELLLPHEEFKRSVFSRQLQPNLPAEFVNVVRTQHSAIRESSNRMRKYLGWYNSYLRSPTYRNQVVRDLTVIYMVGEYVFSKSISTTRASRGGHRLVQKSEGIVFWRNHQLLIVETSNTMLGACSTSILYDTPDASVGRLYGIYTSTGREPGYRLFSSRLTMEYIGQKVNIRQALSSIGLLAVDDPSLDQDIVSDPRLDLLLI